MAVYVDEIVVRPHARGRFKAGSCHLMADTLPELHAFAKQIGVARHWFHRTKRHPHYDLVESERVKAIAAGAEAMSGVEMIRRLTKQREG
jgi:hypothetical protein